MIIASFLKQFEQSTIETIAVEHGIAERDSN